MQVIMPSHQPSRCQGAECYRDRHVGPVRVDPSSARSAVTPMTASTRERGLARRRPVRPVVGRRPSLRVAPGLVPPVPPLRPPPRPRNVCAHPPRSVRALRRRRASRTTRRARERSARPTRSWIDRFRATRAPATSTSCSGAMATKAGSQSITSLDVMRPGRAARPAGRGTLWRGRRYDGAGLALLRRRRLQIGARRVNGYPRHRRRARAGATAASRTPADDAGGSFVRRLSRIRTRQAVRGNSSIVGRRSFSAEQRTCKHLAWY